jgi:hypothetical protein
MKTGPWDLNNITSKNLSEVATLGVTQICANGGNGAWQTENFLSLKSCY